MTTDTETAPRLYWRWSDIAPRAPWIGSRAKMLFASRNGTAPPSIRAHPRSEPYWDAEQVAAWIKDRERTLTWPGKS